jgi:hypothetical protein
LLIEAKGGQQFLLLFHIDKGASCFAVQHL